MNHTIIVVSGGVGSSGEQLVRTVMAQFPAGELELIVLPHVHYESQVQEAISRAKALNATLVHTMVEPGLRRRLTDLCREAGVYVLDLMGDLIGHLEAVSGVQAVGQPGLYRKLNKDYFERVAAIEYAMAHDDGRHVETWPQADILLLGVSRTGKTPLALLLSVLGWKTANYPFVIEIEPPEALLKLDPGRVIGLTIEPGQLILLRRERQRRIGVAGTGSYTDPEMVFQEIEAAQEFCNRHGFSLLDVTDKPLETTADEVIRLITSRFKVRSRVDQSD